MKSYPEMIIFDVDGVLVDTRHSFQRTTLQTVRSFTKKRVTVREWHAWKNRPGFNDDWKLSTQWINDLGVKITFDEVKTKFQEIYWGDDGAGNVANEKWLLPKTTIQRLAKGSDLAIFTGRLWKELNYTLDRNELRGLFRIVTVEDVKNPKPAPDGLLKLLEGRDPGVALYIGDNVDDALAAQSAKVPFVGVLPRSSHARRERGPGLDELGALAILADVNELEDWLRTSVDRPRSIGLKHSRRAQTSANC